jgi:hypothetical protein
MQQSFVLGFIVGRFEKLIRNTYFSLSPCGDISTTPAPTPSTLFDPLKYIVYTFDVVGMTIWVGQGQSHLPADVPGITATSGHGGRLQPKGQLR